MYKPGDVMRCGGMVIAVEVFGDRRRLTVLMSKSQRLRWVWTYAAPI